MGCFSSPYRRGQYCINWNASFNEICPLLSKVTSFPALLIASSVTAFGEPFFNCSHFSFIFSSTTFLSRYFWTTSLSVDAGLTTVFLFKFPPITSLSRASSIVLSLGSLTVFWINSCDTSESSVDRPLFCSLTLARSPQV